MLEMIFVLVRAMALACRGHHELVLENLALRQQLSALKRTGTRPQLRRRDRLFWIVLAQTWRHWREAPVLVQPDTVVRWHREWLRRWWTRRSARIRAGRPSTEAAIRTLVSKMARHLRRILTDYFTYYHGTLPLGALCWAAAGKDPGFTPFSLVAHQHTFNGTRIAAEVTTEPRITPPLVPASSTTPS